MVWSLASSRLGSVARQSAGGAPGTAVPGQTNASGVLVSIHNGWAVAVTCQDRGAEGVAAVGRAHQQHLDVIIGAAADGVAEAGVGHVQRAAGAGERVGELVLVAGPARGRQAEGVAAQGTGCAHHGRCAHAPPLLLAVPRVDIRAAVAGGTGPP